MEGAVSNGEAFGCLVFIAAVVALAAMCSSNCTQKKCSAGKRPRIVDSQCLCVEVPR
jgi:hypothetical protein